MKRALLVLVAVSTARAQPAPPTDPRPTPQAPAPQTPAPQPPPPTPAPDAPTPQAPAPQAPAPQAPDAPTAPDVPTSSDDSNPVLTPISIDHATCLALDTTPGALLEIATPTGQLATPIPWSEFVVDGDLVERPAVAHALLEPTMQEHRTTLSNATWKEIAAVTTKFGYQLVGHSMTDTPTGGRLALHLAPLPMIRKVNAHVKFSGTITAIFDRLLDDEVKRRMRVRTGSYLPWDPTRRKCALFEETERISDYLHDEGYADATVEIKPTLERDSVILDIDVSLGEKYRTGKIDITPQVGGEKLAVPAAEIKKLFSHCSFTLGPLCAGDAQFTRTQHTEDLQKVRELFQLRGYPSVRVQSSFDSRTSFNRARHTVDFTLTIDQRRLVDVRFEGDFNRGETPTDELRKQLTFNVAGSADDVEASASARALAAYMQGRGYFDARVTVERQRLDILDKYVFRIEAGPQREVADVNFVGNTQFKADQLRNLVATKEAGFRGSILGTNTAATSAQLGLDVVRIQEAYRKIGYRETTVARAASTSPAALDSTALTAALVLAEVGKDLHVQFTIDEGQPTLLTRLALDIQAATKERADALCDDLLRELANELSEPQFATRDRTSNDACVATAANLNFKEDEVATTRDRVRDFLYRSGRPRATVEYETKELGPHRMTAQYKIRTVDELRIGKVIIRGAFHTRPSVIYGELRLHEGDLLTTDALAEGARRLRNTGLFNSVNIDLPDLCANQTQAVACASSSLIVNAVVRVEERYDYLAQVEVNAGYSSYNGGFIGGTYNQRNIFGLGLAWTLSGTFGTKITDVETTFLIPQWIIRRVSPVEFRTELTGLIRQQDTPRFGRLDTEGASIALSRQWQRQHIGTIAGRAITAGLHYDFRLRTREVDALRPIGVNQDSSQVAIGTRTGSIGLLLDWEERVDRNGALAPLSPEGGFRLEASAAYASPYLFGQDTFVKLSATASKFVLIGTNLILRGDLRYDQGIPLGGAVLLPEVERFFAGGDSTVRGYSDDRMATELIQVGVPPIGGSLQQIRVIPAGGNIRMLGSLDGQVRIWKILAGAAFADAGLITNEWSSVTVDDIRPSVGMGLRILTPFGVGALEYAIPLRPQLGDDPRGRLHFYFAARAQF